MVIMPLLGIATGTLIGWASTPYNLKWAQTHPKRAAWMSLAGPVSNFTMAIISGIIMRIGLQMGSLFRPSFRSPRSSRSLPAPEGWPGDCHRPQRHVFTQHPAGRVQSDPFSASRWLWHPRSVHHRAGGAARLQEWRMKMGAMAIIGLVVAWQVFDRVYGPLFAASIHILYRGYRFS